MKDIIDRVKQSRVEDWMPFIVSLTLGLLVLIVLYLTLSADIFAIYKNISAYIIGFGIGLTLNNIFKKKEK